jgi:hypothetical protein
MTLVGVKSKTMPENENLEISYNFSVLFTKRRKPFVAANRNRA